MFLVTSVSDVGERSEGSKFIIIQSYIHISGAMSEKTGRRNWEGDFFSTYPDPISQILLYIYTAIVGTKPEGLLFLILLLRQDQIF